MPINGEFIKSPDIYKKMKFAIICKKQSLANMIATPGKELLLKSVLSNIFVFFREKKKTHWNVEVSKTVCIKYNTLVCYGVKLLTDLLTQFIAASQTPPNF